MVFVPGRPYKSNDKAKAEVGVQIVERWIMARLRHETFFSLRQLKLKIQELLVGLNQRKMKKHPSSMKNQFDAIDKPDLKPQVPLTVQQRTYLLELIDARYDTKSTLIASQLPIANWVSR
jgi:hypothetical protein